jgi:hypothetical protein
MKKLFALILTGTILLTGCGGGGFFDDIRDNAAGGFSAPETTGWFVSQDASYKNPERLTFGETSENEVAGAAVSAVERKVIRDVFMHLEAKEEQGAVELFRQISAFNAYLGGFEFSSEISNHELFSHVSAVLKVPPERLDEFLEYANENATVLNSRMDSDDVTSEYFDITTRLETKRRSLESYYVLLENAESLEDIISLQRTIDSITEEIEAFEGRLRVLNSLVSMATVTLFIRQENDPAPAEFERREIDWNALSLDDMGYFIRSGVVSVLNFIASVFQWLIIAVIVSSPVVIPAVILAVVSVKRQRRKNKLLMAEYTKNSNYRKSGETEKSEESEKEKDNK